MSFYVVDIYYKQSGLPYGNWHIGNLLFDLVITLIIATAAAHQVNRFVIARDNKAMKAGSPASISVLVATGVSVLYAIVFCYLFIERRYFGVNFYDFSRVITIPSLLMWPFVAVWTYLIICTRRRQ